MFPVRVTTSFSLMLAEVTARFDKSGATFVMLMVAVCHPSLQPP